MSENVPVDAVETTLELLAALPGEAGVGLTELAEEVGIPKSTAFNHLQTLEGKEYVVNEDGQYRLSCRLLELGAQARRYHGIYEAAQSEVDRLAAETGEISALLVEEHGYGVFLYRVEGAEAVHIDSYVGQRIYLHGAALGKALLSQLPRERVGAIVDERGLPQLTSNTITERETLFAELDAVAERGVAFDDQERLTGLRSVAVPLSDAEGTPLGAVSLAGPSSRVQDERFREEFPDTVADAADVIELNMTYG
jgi:DNA-binding IclR family transcriptional regulator